MPLLPEITSGPQPPDLDEITQRRPSLEDQQIMAELGTRLGVEFVIDYSLASNEIRVGGKSIFFDLETMKVTQEL